MEKDNKENENLKEKISKLEEQLEKTDKEAKINDSAARFAIFAGLFIPCIAGGGILLSTYLIGAGLEIEEVLRGIDVNKYNTIATAMIGSGLVTGVANALGMCYLERKARKGEIK